MIAAAPSHDPTPSPAAPAPGEQPSAEFLAELAAESARLEPATPDEIIAWAHDRYAPGLAMGTAFGPEGCLMLSLIPRIAPTTWVFNLETGYQFQQTLDLRDRIAAKYGVEVELLQPELSVPEYEAAHGGPLYRTEPDRCCHDRKIKVLERAARGRTAWMSGIRRDQSPVRAKQPIVAWDRKFGLVKVSPMANATKSDVWRRILAEGVPYNPLHDQGYPSVGCWPCTRRADDGADERAGRWADREKTECGLHTDGGGI
ncbi:MAG: phosphoadenylyl-sulfate reductase [Planctomycetota bacterium]